MPKVPSTEGPPCPTCKKRYGNIERHGRKHHPYEVEHDQNWIALLKGEDPAARRSDATATPLETKEVPPPRKSMATIRETVWESPMPYRSTFHLEFESISWDEANDLAHELLVRFREQVEVLGRKNKAKIEIEQTHERF